MAKIYEIMDAKKKKQSKSISFAEHLERAKEKLKPKRQSKQDKPAEVLTIDEIKRMMGDTTRTQFLRDKANRRK